MLSLYVRWGSDRLREAGRGLLSAYWPRKGHGATMRRSSLLAALLILGVASNALAQTTTIYLTSGSTWVVPSDWNSANNSVEVIGAGGGGKTGVGSRNGAGGGGGGGGYS